MLLEEIFPATVYYKDIWHDDIKLIIEVAGLAPPAAQFVNLSRGSF